jgi:hypothetical protein
VLPCAPHWLAPYLERLLPNLCSMLGQAHKRLWQSKSKQKHPICKPTDDASGKKASLDQMVSAQPGLILQMSGCLTNLHIMALTIFVDHFSDHFYVYLMKDLMLSETLLAKHDYESFLASLGVESKAYHADNVSLQIRVSEMIVLPVIK